MDSQVAAITNDPWKVFLQLSEESEDGTLSVGFQRY